MVTYSGAPSSSAAVEDVRQVGTDMYDKLLLPTRKDVAERGGVLGYLGLSRWYVQRTHRPSPSPGEGHITSPSPNGRGWALDAAI